MRLHEFLTLARTAGFISLAPIPDQPNVFRFGAGGYNCLMSTFQRNGEVINAQLFAGFTVAVDPEKCNRWNHDMRFVKAYVRKDGVLALEFDFATVDIDREYLAEIFVIWNVLLSRVGGEYFE
jgi:hypothetical protein